MSTWQRPLGLKALIGMAIVAGSMTLALASMVWNRARLLETGAEILLKSAPVDPRDLLLGYYAQLSYDISTIRLDQLAKGDPAVIGDGFRHNQTVYVRLMADADGYWSPVSLHRSMPTPLSRSTVIRGTVAFDACRQRLEETPPRCSVNLRYGIEKFFAPQERAQEIERARVGIAQSRIEAIDAELRLLEPRRQALLTPERPLNAAGRERAKRELATLDARMSDLRQERDRLSDQAQQQRASVAERLAVIVRVSPTTGEAAIAGLRLDGKTFYEERLF